MNKYRILECPFKAHQFPSPLTRTARSACDAPPIMLGTKLLWPGASKMVKCFLSVSKYARPTSTVFPLSLSSWLVSKAHDRYLGHTHTHATGWNTQAHTEPRFWSNATVAHQVSRFFSLASLSYFSRVLLSTIPVRYLEGEEHLEHGQGTFPGYFLPGFCLNGT